MKKLLFAANTLEVGGIEKALVTLTNYLAKRDYQVTIVLEEKKGVFLKDLDSKINVIEYKVNNNKNILIRKACNLLNRIKFYLKYKNKYDFSACYATYSIPSSFVARTASVNSCMWGHADYLTLFNNNIDEVKRFFEERNYNKFKHIVFVSQEGKDSFIKIFPECKDKVIDCNNMINGDMILNLSKEEIDIKKENRTTFLNVGRHDEKQKKLTRIIEACEKLKEDNIDFRLLMVGDGPDTEKYKELVDKKHLEDNIKFLGMKSNPYPYFLISDCVILSSDYEGYPVVFLESKILNKPIITTKVSDYKEIEENFGFVTEKDVNDIYNKMKMFIQNGYEIKEKFDYNDYNNKIFEKLEKII